MECSSGDRTRRDTDSRTGQHLELEVLLIRGLSLFLILQRHFVNISTRIRDVTSVVSGCRSGSPDFSVRREKARVFSGGESQPAAVVPYFPDDGELAPSSPGQGRHSDGDP